MNHWTDEAWNAANERPTGLIFREVVDVRAAQVAHTCSVCRHDIAPGTSYRREVTMAKGRGAPHVHKEHLPNCYV